MWCADAIGQDGLLDACVMHGLLKTAARILAQAALSARHITSITGHSHRLNATPGRPTKSGAPPSRARPAGRGTTETGQSGKHNHSRVPKQVVRGLKCLRNFIMQKLIIC